MLCLYGEERIILLKMVKKVNSRPGQRNALDLGDKKKKLKVHTFGWKDLYFLKKSIKDKEC